MAYGVKVIDGVVVDRVVGVPDGYISTNGEPQIGWLSSNGELTAPPAASKTWDEVRLAREGLLTQSDWTQMADAPLTSDQKQAWANYRQDLRDLPQDYSDPDSVVWPTKPSN